MAKINIINLVIEWQDKIHGQYRGGFKYGHDYNILRAMVDYHNDKGLVLDLVKSIKDKTLASKIKLWMAGDMEKTTGG